MDVDIQNSSVESSFDAERAQETHHYVFVTVSCDGRNLACTACNINYCLPSNLLYVLYRSEL